MSARVTRKRARTQLESAYTNLSSTSSTDTPSPDTAAAAATFYAAATPFCPASSSESDSDNLEHGHGHDTEFWYNDGTVILVSKDVQFRVYRGLLADSSPIFKAIFDATAVAAAVPIDEHQAIACPVVLLTHSPEDLRHIPREYFSRKQPSFFNDHDVPEPSFHQILAYIRLGQKYQLKELYDRSLRFLKHYYTDDFETWSQDHCTDDIVRGFQKEDGTWETLSPQDLARCLYGGKDIHQVAVVAAVRTFQDRVSPDCRREKNCRAALHRALQGLEKVDWLLSGCPIRLAHDKLLPRRRGVGLGTCKECTTMVEERNKKERAAIWAKLPCLLDIEVPGWGDGLSQGEAS
ncbi:hypothetical protein GSI_12034 [Ganoderma sinense ZZ0214-1]|uniref:BTB domain-containing protein n=1 Tax=Ganoderma sinense ZZ0214-1 TaxID=1077348 RepID=A0A2G8RY82_9APHY|nr:hypothetical protein GSI_12034 [Ganoderma sinense ZZ0214-1]